MNRSIALAGGLLVVALALGQYATTQSPPADPPTDTPAQTTQDAPTSESNQQAEMPKMEKSADEWRKQLTAEEYRVLREKGTERAFTGEYDEHFEPGAYVCAACGLELFESDAKFNSGCGWPAFYTAKAGDRVQLTPDYSHGMIRTEVTCSRCDGHLGHVFEDAPQTPTGQRYCINSVSLKFIPKDKLAEYREADADKQAELAKKAAAKPRAQAEPSATSDQAP